MTNTATLLFKNDTSGRRHSCIFKAFTLMAGMIMLLSAPISGAQQQLIAAAQTTQQYQLNVHIWQDNALLSAPKMIAYENEVSELIISNPDTLKLALRLQDVNAVNNQDGIEIDGQIFLPHAASNGDITLSEDQLWEQIATPKVLALPGERSMMEIDVSNRGLTHSDGRTVETIKVIVQVNTPE